MFDYFDAGIMERLQFSLVQMTERRTSGLIDGTAGNTVALKSKAWVIMLITFICSYCYFICLDVLI